MKERIWAARILSGLGVAFLIFVVGALLSYVALFPWGGRWLPNDPLRALVPVMRSQV